MPSLLLLAASAWLVLHKGDSSLGFYSADGKLEAKVAVNAHPHEMVRSADGKLLFTTDNGTMRIEQAGRGGNTVSIIDLTRREKIGEISTGEFRRPHGITRLPDGHLLVSTELPDALLRIDPVRRAVVRVYPTQGKTAHMVTASRDGQWAWVSNSTSSNVSAIHLPTGEVKLIPTGPRPEGSVLSPTAHASTSASAKAAASPKSTPPPTASSAPSTPAPDPSASMSPPTAASSSTACSMKKPSPGPTPKPVKWPAASNSPPRSARSSAST